MKIKQRVSDELWGHYQNSVPETFDSSYSRLRFLADRCRRKTKVLNVGAGSGYLESLLAQRGAIAYTLDPSALTIQRLNEEQGMAGRAMQGHCNAIPFPADFFDTVIMSEVLEHIPTESLEDSLNEVRRVLRRSGKFFGTVPYREALPANEVYCPHCHAQFHRWGHVQSFDEDSLRSSLLKAGFVIDKLYCRTFPDFRRPGARQFLRSIFRYVLGRIGEPLVAPNLYFVVSLA